MFLTFRNAFIKGLVYSDFFYSVHFIKLGV
jgi:hypothetical protein